MSTQPHLCQFWTDNERRKRENYWFILCDNFFSELFAAAVATIIVFSYLAPLSLPEVNDVNSQLADVDIFIATIALIS